MLTKTFWGWSLYALLLGSTLGSTVRNFLQVSHLFIFCRHVSALELEAAMSVMSLL